MFESGSLGHSHSLWPFECIVENYLQDSRSLWWVAICLDTANRAQWMLKSIYIWKLEVWLIQGGGGGWQIVLELNWLSRHTFRRRQWHPTPVLLPGKSHGQSSLVGCSLWGREGQTWLSDFTFTFPFHALEKEMATHSSVLAWRIPGTAEPGGLLSMGTHRVRHDWSDLAAAAAGTLLNLVCVIYMAWLCSVLIDIMGSCNFLFPSHALTPEFFMTPFFFADLPCQALCSPLTGKLRRKEWPWICCLLRWQ